MAGKKILIALLLAMPFFASAQMFRDSIYVGSQKRYIYNTPRNFFMEKLGVDINGYADSLMYVRSDGRGFAFASRYSPWKRNAGTGDTYLFGLSDDVAIGTTSTVNRLGVNGRASIGAGYINTASPTNGLLVEGSVGVGTSSILSGAQLGIGGTNVILALQGSTSNLINMGSAGAAVPTFTTRSAGTKLLMYSALSGSTVDYAIGIASSTVWYSVPSAISSAQHAHYAGTTQLTSFRGDGQNGFGVADPTAIMHLAAGQSGAGFGAFKFTLAGAVKLATPERGVLEPESNFLYYTDSTATRSRLVLQGNNTLEKNTTLNGLFDFKIGNLIRLDTIQYRGSKLLIDATNGTGFIGDVTLTSNTIIDVANNIRIITGAGSPEGSIIAGIGSTFHRNNGSTGTTLYIKESGTGNTGWVAVASGSSWNGNASTDLDMNQFDIVDGNKATLDSADIDVFIGTTKFTGAVEHIGDVDMNSYDFTEVDSLTSAGTVTINSTASQIPLQVVGSFHSLSEFRSPNASGNAGIYLGNNADDNNTYGFYRIGNGNLILSMSNDYPFASEDDSIFHYNASTRVIDFRTSAIHLNGSPLAGTVGGAGQTNKLPVWTSSGNIGFESSMHVDTTNNRLGLGTATPDKTLGLGDGTDEFSISTASDKLTVWNDVSTPVAIVTIDSSGTLDAKGLKINGASILDGTWTPTLTNTLNVSASTAYACNYVRVGNTVTVSGRVDVDATATGSVLLEMSLPIASDFAAFENAGGTAAGTTGTVSAIYASHTNDRLVFAYTAAVTTNEPLHFSATYRIL